MSRNRRDETTEVHFDSKRTVGSFAGPVARVVPPPHRVDVVVDKPIHRNAGHVSAAGDSAGIDRERLA